VTRPRSLIRIAALLLLFGLVACGAPEPGPIDRDPLQGFNRGVHVFNRELDRNAVRPASTAYDVAVPDEVEYWISDFARNADTPRIIVNQILQFNLKEAGVMTWRFLINSTLGIAGLWDPASTLDVPVYQSDFGETLYTWGVGEGAYVELPLAGPSTVRDGVGAVVDLFINPLSYVLPSPESYIATVAGVGAFLTERSKLRDTYDSVLYESEDSYGQSRLAYLQKRRFELGITGSTDYQDPADDPYFDPYGATETSNADPLSDPYFDPYAQ
jgi:phospholipid-binding lipoprotein MlaA